jgi:arylformamidase
LKRIAGVVSISGVHDLRPLMRTEMNDTLHIDMDEARSQSPVLLEPLLRFRLRPGWVQMSDRNLSGRTRALFYMWRGFETPMAIVEEAGRHHFDVIDGLADPDHPLCKTVVGVVRLSCVGILPGLKLC